MIVKTDCDTDGSFNNTSLEAETGVGEGEEGGAGELGQDQQQHVVRQLEDAGLGLVHHLQQPRDGYFPNNLPNTE